MRVPRVTVDVMAGVIALAEKKSMKAAGEELGVTASAIHKRIQIANGLFQTRLFAGNKESLHLTEAGAVFYAHAIKAMEQVLLVEETTIASAEIQAKHLLVGHSTYLPPRLLALLHDLNFISLLGIRLEHKPGLTLTLVRDVLQGTVHVGVGYLPVNHPDLLVYQLTEEPVLVCMPSGHPLANKAFVRPRDLEGHPIIAASREVFPMFHQLVEEFFLDFGVKLNIVADAYGPPEAVSMVEQKVGICLLTASNIRSKALVAAKPLSPQTLTRKCCLFVRENNRHSSLKSFVELMLEKTARWRPLP